MTIDPQLYTLLIVDDEERLRKAMERSFRQEGYQTFTAASGEDALAVLQTEKVDLVITDLVMPGMDGMALVRAIRSSDPGMKVIVLTAYGSAESMAEAKALEVAHYLTKPFDLFHLKSRVKRLLKAPGALELACVGQSSKALSWICSTAGKAVGAAVEVPRKTLPYVQPERVVCAAGKVAGCGISVLRGYLAKIRRSEVSNYGQPDCGISLPGPRCVGCHGVVGRVRRGPSRPASRGIPSSGPCRRWCGDEAEGSLQARDRGRGPGGIKR